MLHKPFTSPFDAPFIELPSVESTNNYALAAIREGSVVNGTAYFTRKQTAGKGQMGKKWATEPGSNIALSVAIDPKPLTLTHQFQLSAAVAVAAQQFLQNYAGEEMRIKWPNDLYWRDRKLGGILIESTITTEKDLPQWKWAVAGIGININQVQFPPDLPNPVSLKQITGKNYDASTLARELHLSILNGIKGLHKKGFEPLLSLYISNLFRLNEIVRLKKNSRVFQTNIKTVTPIGKLVTESNGLEQEFDFGEISWVI